MAPASRGTGMDPPPGTVEAEVTRLPAEATVGEGGTTKVTRLPAEATVGEGGTSNREPQRRHPRPRPIDNANIGWRPVGVSCARHASPASFSR